MQRLAAIVALVLTLTGVIAGAASATNVQKVTAP